MKKIALLIFLTIFSNNFLIASIKSDINGSSDVRDNKIESLLDLLTVNDLSRLEKLLNLSNFYLPVNILKKILGFWDENINLKDEDIDQNFIILKNKNKDDQKISILEKSKNLLIKIIKNNIAVIDQLCGLTWEFFDIIRNNKIKNLSKSDQQKLSLINIDGLSFFIKEYCVDNPNLIDDFADKFFNIKYGIYCSLREKLENNNYNYYDTVKFNLIKLPPSIDEIKGLDENISGRSYKKIFLEIFNFITEFYRIYASDNKNNVQLNRAAFLNILSNISNTLFEFFDNQYSIDNKISKKLYFDIINNFIRLKFVFNDLNILKNNNINKDKLLVAKNLDNLKKKQYYWLLINKLFILSSYFIFCDNQKKNYDSYNLLSQYLYNFSEICRKYCLYKN